MALGTNDAWRGELKSVSEARQTQLGFRFLCDILVVVAFQVFLGWPVALAWLAVVAAIQTAESVLTGSLLSRNRIGFPGTVAGFALMACSSIAFNAVGVALAISADVWALIAAVLVWTGAIANAVLTSRASVVALIASGGPPALMLLMVPFVAVTYQQSIYVELALLAGCALNAFAAANAWGIMRRLSCAADSAEEASILAYTDSETGLPNRLAFERRLTDRLARSKEPGTYVAVFCVDRFAQFRAAFGFDVFGDLIGEIAAVLARKHGPDADVARINSIMIGLIFTARDDAEAVQYTETLRSDLDGPVSLGSYTIDVSMTVGLSSASENHVLSALERATVAVDGARARHRRICMFDSRRYGDPTGNLSLISDMNRAMDNGELSVAYQPQYDIETGRVASAEVLARWRSPTRGNVPPDVFVCVAEETGNIRRLSEWVLDRAIADQAALAGAGFDIAMSVNVSAQLLGDRKFTSDVIDKAAAATGDLIVEVTETAMMNEPDMAIGAMADFVGAGITIAIDDYGTGHSSLAYLKDIPASELKIDKTFIDHIEDDEREAMLVRSTIDMAHGLGLRVTAEGVETPGALARLARLGCDTAQGYLIARPMPLADLQGFLSGRMPSVDAAPEKTVLDGEPPAALAMA